MGDRATEGGGRGLYFSWNHQQGEGFFSLFLERSKRATHRVRRSKGYSNRSKPCRKRMHNLYSNVLQANSLSATETLCIFFILGPGVYLTLSQGGLSSVYHHQKCS